MAEKTINVNISPRSAQEIVERSITADLIYSELNNVDENIEFGVSVFEKYFFRNSSRAALTVIFRNIDGITTVKAIATGSSEGLFFNIDWGAGNNFVNSAIECLKEYM